MKRFAIVLLASVLLAGISLPLAAVTSLSSPSVSAHHAALYEPVTDTFLYEKNGDERAPMASTTKIMTALVALERGDLETVVTIPDEACHIEGSSIYMTPGEHLTLRELLYALLLQSANDAATAIAISVGGSVPEFARMMNERAQEMGLQNTHFVNPHGLDDPEHYTTAHDLARITACAMEIPVFRDIVGTVKYRIPQGDGGDMRVLFNHNKLLRLYRDSVGVKTGFTKKSGRCLVGAACRDGVTLISVTLDAPNDWNDHITLFEYGFSRMENRLLAEKGSFLYSLPVIGKEGGTVLCTNSEDATAILARDEEAPEVKLDLPHYLTSRGRVGAVVGHLQFYRGDRLVCEVPLVITDESPTM